MNSYCFFCLRKIWVLLRLLFYMTFKNVYGRSKMFIELLPECVQIFCISTAIWTIRNILMFCSHEKIWKHLWHNLQDSHWFVKCIVMRIHIKYILCKLSFEYLSLLVHKHDPKPFLFFIKLWVNLFIVQWVIMHKWNLYRLNIPDTVVMRSNGIILQG